MELLSLFDYVIVLIKELTSEISLFRGYPYYVF